MPDVLASFGWRRAAVLGAAAAAALALAGTAHAYRFEPLVEGLAAPVHVAAAPGEPATLYVVEQAGRIRIVRGGKVTGTFLDIADRVRSGGEQGLLSLAFHPGYARNHRFYVDYTDNAGNTRVVEFRSRGGVAIPSSARRLLLVRQPYANHNGGQLQFDRDGLLYVGMGDGGSAGDPQQHAQYLGSRLGKLLRTDPLRPTGWEIVGYGLRNPWRFSFDRITGDLWIGDVGQNAWEEVDVRPAAKVGRRANYGWGRWEGDAVYDSSRPLTRAGDLVFPVAVYPHAAGNCSITGGYVYRGTAVPAARGRYLYADYCSGRVWSFRVGAAGRASAPRVEPFRLPGVSSFGEDGKGELYATSLGGTLYRLVA